MRALVTGASGCIGRHALEPLLSSGFEVHALARSSTGRDGAPDPRLTWHAADLLDGRAASALVADVRPEVLLHFAWNATPGVYWTAPDNADWQRATVDLFSAFVRAGGRRFVGAGTCAEYEWSSAAPCDERQTPTCPATLYGRCKLDTWTTIERLASDAGVSAAWGRIFHLFGSDEHPSRLAPSVARSLLKGEPALCTHGEQVRDFLYVKDVAGAFVTLLRSQVEGPVNIGSGETHQVKDVVLGIARRLGRPELVRLGARESNEPARLVPSVARLFDDVGWRPSMSFDEALDETVDYWRRRAG